MLQYMDMGYLSTSQIANELNFRGYFAATTPPASTPTTPPANKPTATIAQILAWCAEAALANYGYSPTATAKTYIASTTWDNIIETALIIDQQIEQQYTVLSGLADLGATDPCAGKTGFDLDSCLLTDTNTPAGGWIGWDVITRILTLGVLTWEMIMEEKKRLSGQGYSFYSPTPGTADYENKIQQLMAQLNCSRAQAVQYLGSYNTPASQYPSWLLPLGVGAGVYLLMSRRP